MFKNALIVEDHETTNISLQVTLAELKVDKVEHIYHCDTALTLVKNSLKAAAPYDLLITDLYFEPDDFPQQLSGGVALITAVKQIQPEIKILVFSAEHKPAVIDLLFKNLGINGYVRKARRDAEELKVAIQAIYDGKTHIPPLLKQAIKQKNAYNFSNFEIAIITLLSQGILQKDIPVKLRQKNIEPAALRTVEKHLGLMKNALEFTKNEQLVAFCKDMGII